ncbi:MAG: NUDIX domain-containing protein [Candidatus Colwellbacteria bacterium]|nr:NUDIX domain-containing protein [Candidatus Colwellbacteria bacterium]
MKRVISAGLIIYRKTPLGPRFLLLYHGGRYWNFPKGKLEHVDANGEVLAHEEGAEGLRAEEAFPRGRRERSIDAAVRETLEETGISSSELAIKNGFRAHEKFRFQKDGEAIFKVVILYLAEFMSSLPDVKITEGHEGYGWFLYKDAQFFLRSYTDTRAILKKAYDFLKGHGRRARTGRGGDKKGPR